MRHRFINFDAISSLFDFTSNGSTLRPEKHIGSSGQRCHVGVQAVIFEPRYIGDATHRLSQVAQGRTLKAVLNAADSCI